METVKGFQDFLGTRADEFALIKELARQTFEKYNFQELQTPIIEQREFVTSGTDEGDDAISEIFKLEDRGKRKLALRYEFTFQLKRIAKGQKTPFKRFQIGPVFRDEPVTKNRFRQFMQCDVDVIGAKIYDQAEFLSAIKTILDSLKIKSIIYVNNKRLLNEILEKEGITKNKTDIIRALDKLDKLSEKEVGDLLKEYRAENLLKIVKQKEEFFKQYESYSEIEELRKYAKFYGVEIVFQPALARGLSYYTGNVFEIKSDIKETICGGGTYEIDGIESSGISFSIERLMAVSNLKINLNRTLVVSLNQDKKAIELSKKLRQMGQNTSVFIGKPNKAMAYANSYNFTKVVFVGEKEVEKKKYMIKNLITGKEVLLTIEKK